MSDNLKLGQIITTPQHRDAVHVAVAPVKAGCPLVPGQRVALKNGIANFEVRGNAIGIVDPFLQDNVRTSQTFWLFLFPGTITALRHEWTHPAFEPKQSPKAKSEAWLTDIANRCGVSYERMMEAVKEDDYINMGENEAYKDVIDPVLSEFHQHCAVVIGRETAAYPFSCSC